MKLVPRATLVQLYFGSKVYRSWKIHHKLTESCKEIDYQIDASPRIYIEFISRNLPTSHGTL